MYISKRFSPALHSVRHLKLTVDIDIKTTKGGYKCAANGSAKRLVSFRPSSCPQFKLIWAWLPFMNWCQRERNVPNPTLWDYVPIFKTIIKAARQQKIAGWNKCLSVFLSVLYSRYILVRFPLLSTSLFINSKSMKYQPLSHPGQRDQQHVVQVFSLLQYVYCYDKLKDRHLGNYLPMN